MDNYSHSFFWSINKEGKNEKIEDKKKFLNGPIILCHYIMHNNTQHNNNQHNDTHHDDIHYDNNE
jgi:hypothetical protein